MKLHDQLTSLLRGKNATISISFNGDHACNNETAQEWHDAGFYRGDDDDRIDWVSEEERLKAIRENSVWVMQWYPDTQIGFYCVGASTLDAVLERVLSTPDDWSE